MLDVLSETFADEVFYGIDRPFDGNIRGERDSRALFEEGSIERNACLVIVRIMYSDGMKENVQAAL